MSSSVPDPWASNRVHLLDLCTAPTPEPFRMLAAEYCKTANLITLLAEETHQRFRSFMASVDIEHQLSIPAFRDISGTAMLSLDATAADMLETIGEYGRRYAVEIRRDSAIRARCIASTAPSADELEMLLHIWSPTPDGTPRFVQGLTRVVFLDVLKPKLARARANPPAVSAVVMKDAARLLRRGVRLDVARRVLVDHRGKMICRIGSGMGGDGDPSAQDLEMLSKGVPLLGSLQAHRVLRFIIGEAHKAWILEKGRSSRVHVPRGWTGLADAVVAGHSKNAANQLRVLVETLSLLRFDWSFGDGGRVLSFEFTPAVGQRASDLQLIVGDALLPLAVYKSDKQKRGERTVRLLVPMLPLPPRAGRRADWAAQATMQLLALTELHEHPQELAECGGALVSEERWLQLAEQAGVPRATVDDVLHAWTRGTPETRPFLQRHAGDIYSLGDTHEDAREFFVSGAKRRLSERRRGRRSAALRRLAAQHGK